MASHAFWSPPDQLCLLFYRALEFWNFYHPLPSKLQVSAPAPTPTVFFQPRSGLTAFDLALLCVCRDKEGLSEKPEDVDQPQKRQESKPTCKEKNKLGHKAMSILPNTHLEDLFGRSSPTPKFKLRSLLLGTQISGLLRRIQESDSSALSFSGPRPPSKSPRWDQEIEAQTPPSSGPRPFPQTQESAPSAASSVFDPRIQAQRPYFPLLGSWESGPYPGSTSGTSSTSPRWTPAPSS